MNLDWRICSRARLARDARFDGKFFIGVLSTGIYCRPICRARTSKESNVRYFPTAACAAEAGFRPCLRCRPECSPGTPAWAGTQKTVSRALQLISENGLEDGGVEGLAERLGMGSRHLRRLFLRHLGATPSAVAHTRRLHFAKKLIDETRLPMSQIAIAAGFGTVRRFNAAIQKVYRRTPTHIRRLACVDPSLAQNEYSFRLNFRPPYNWRRILEFLSSGATRGVEAVESGHYRRSIRLNGRDGQIEVSLDNENNALIARVLFGDSQMLFWIIERIRAMFDLNADWAVIGETLRADPILRRRMDADPGLRVPGCWDGFELGVCTILGQQRTRKGATALAGRMVSHFGQRLSAANGVTHLFPTPEAIAGADLARIGITRPVAETVRVFARAVCDRQIRFDGVPDYEAFRVRLREIPGIGEWAAQFVVMRALRDPDALPASDVELCHRMGCTSAELKRRSEAWRPWRSYAAILLWQSSGRGESRAKIRVPSYPYSALPLESGPW
ncbi:MAG TPA: AlkA N-terminal domain-containing protein [Candidatus Acidoferrales bacterium]|nr:AlkA N-terminal domain-containing protein [Candidatus Acidoferrales bacterium]